MMCGCDENDAGTEPELVDLTGSWELVTTVTSNNCGLSEGETKTEVIYLECEGSEVTITNFGGVWGSGQIEDGTLTFVGTERIDDFGCPATMLTEGTGLIYETEINGTFNSVVSFDEDSCFYLDPSDCSITSSFVMTPMEESPCLDRAVFGDPGNSEYVLPYPIGAAYAVYQSYCWPTGGHRNQLAYDFTMPIGDAVVAARIGVVREVREDSPDNGEGYGEHNFVYIEHGDGTLASYAHLMQYSVTVEPGDTVSIGQQFASSGNSGESGEPHLHFLVYQAYPAVEGVDVPVNFRNADGPLDSRGGLVRGEVYLALPY
jgi:hypothetical protein